MRIKICLFFLMFVVGLFSISGKGKTNYTSLTDHDRIMLGISYYEVALKYKELGKEDLYESYMNEALRIERNVKKYAIGELEIPEKKIEINLDGLFPADEENSDTDNTGDEMSMISNEVKKKKFNLII